MQPIDGRILGPWTLSLTKELTRNRNQDIAFKTVFLQSVIKGQNDVTNTDKFTFVCMHVCNRNIPK